MSIETIYNGGLKRLLVSNKKKRKSTRLTLMSGNLVCKTNIELASCRSAKWKRTANSSDISTAVILFVCNIVEYLCMGHMKCLLVLIFTIFHVINSDENSHER